MICESAAKGEDKHPRPLSAKPRGINVDGDQIPSEFQAVLRFARVWAIADDLERCEFIQSASSRSKREMVNAVFPHFETLEAWLATERRRFPMRREARALELILVAATESIFEVYFGE